MSIWFSFPVHQVETAYDHARNGGVAVIEYDEGWRVRCRSELAEQVAMVISTGHTKASVANWMRARTVPRSNSDITVFNLSTRIEKDRAHRLCERHMAVTPIDIPVEVDARAQSDIFGSDV
jgi:hypothetical protein